MRPKPGRSRYGPVWPKPEMRTRTSAGLTAASASQPRCHRSSVPGRKFSVTTCVPATRRFTSAWPSGSRKLQVMDFLLRASASHQYEGAPRCRRTAQPTEIVAHARLLHLDHVGAELAQQGRAEGRGQERREVEHGDTGAVRASVTVTLCYYPARRIPTRALEGAALTWSACPFRRLNPDVPLPRLRASPTQGSTCMPPRAR